MQEPLTRGEVEAYFEKLVALAEEGIRTGGKYVVIVTSDVTKFTARGRKYVAEAQARFMTAERDAITRAAFVPIDSALIRGAITALHWLSPDVAKHIRIVASMEIAFREALEVLEASGSPFRGDEIGLRRALGLQAADGKGHRFR